MLKGKYKKSYKHTKAFAGQEYKIWCPRPSLAKLDSEAFEVTDTQKQAQTTQVYLFVGCRKKWHSVININYSGPAHISPAQLFLPQPKIK